MDAENELSLRASNPEGSRESVVVHPPMNFGEAIAALKRGERVTRFGWNGKGLWLSHETDARKDGDGLYYMAFIALNYPAPQFACKRVSWAPTQTDMLADDWVNLTFPKSEKDMGGGVVEANFALYVDGWTLRGTNNVGEVYASRMHDGASIIFNSASLVGFLERRLQGPLTAVEN